MKKNVRIFFTSLFSVLLAVTFFACDFLNSLSGNNASKENENVSDIQFTPVKTVAAKTDYSAIDSYVTDLNIPSSTSITSAAETITSTAATEKEKARAIFTWICNNIAYDVEADVNDPDYDYDTANSAATTFTERKALCKGYGNLFDALANAAGLTSRYVSGNDKPSGYEIGDKLGNHGWNLVTVGQEKILLDTTWGAGNVNGKVFEKSFKDSWFDVDPAYMILSHYPTEGTDSQLLSTPIGFDEFCNLPRVNPSFERLGVDGKELLEFLQTHKKAWAPNTYNFLESLEYGKIKVVSIPMTDYLSPSVPYIFSFTTSEGDSLSLKTDEEVIPLATAYTFPQTAFVSEDKADLFYYPGGIIGGKGILYYSLSLEKEGSGKEREDHSSASEENENRDDCIKIGKAKVFVIDDEAELIDELDTSVINSRYYNEGNWTYFTNGVYVDVYEGADLKPPFNVKDRVGYYDSFNQWWLSIKKGSALEKTPEVIRCIYKKIDSSISYSRLTPDYQHDISVCVIPLSEKEEWLNQLQSYKNYDWTKDKDMAAFVNWMKGKGYEQELIDYYTDMAQYPSQRGSNEVYEANEKYNDFSWLGVDVYPAKDRLAGGMERYFRTRDRCDQSLWRQEVIPLLFLHYVDKDGKAASFTPWQDVPTLMNTLETERFNAFMSNTLKCYIVEITYDFEKQEAVGVEGYDFEDIIETYASTEVKNAIKNKKYVTVDWFDDAEYMSDPMLRYSSECNAWKLFMTLYRDGDRMHLQHSDLFGADNNNRPSCMADDCLHANAICPLCLYALGY